MLRNSPTEAQRETGLSKITREATHFVPSTSSLSSFKTPTSHPHSMVCVTSSSDLPSPSFLPPWELGRAWMEHSWLGRVYAPHRPFPCRLPFWCRGKTPFLLPALFQLTHGWISVSSSMRQAC